MPSPVRELASDREASMRRIRFEATRAAVVVCAIAAVAVCGYVGMLTSSDRGTGGAALFGFLVACWIGIPFALFGLMTGTRRWERDRRISLESVSTLAVGLALIGVLATSMIGKEWYAADQAEAKAFIDRRIAAAEASGPQWPLTQAAFVGGEPLPRLLRGRQFYSTDPDGSECEIGFEVDWDGGWSWKSDRRDDKAGAWRRST